jgi:hypothetical protein
MYVFSWESSLVGKSNFGGLLNYKALVKKLYNHIIRRTDLGSPLLPKYTNTMPTYIHRYTPNNVVKWLMGLFSLLI